MTFYYEHTNVIPHERWASSIIPHFKEDYKVDYSFLVVLSCFADQQLKSSFKYQQKHKLNTIRLQFQKQAQKHLILSSKNTIGSEILLDFDDYVAQNNDAVSPPLSSQQEDEQQKISIGFL